MAFLGRKPKSAPLVSEGVIYIILSALIIIPEDAPAAVARGTGLGAVAIRRAGAGAATGGLAHPVVARARGVHVVGPRVPRRDCRWWDAVLPIIQTCTMPWRWYITLF